MLYYSPHLVSLHFIWLLYVCTVARLFLCLLSMPNILEGHFSVFSSPFVFLALLQLVAWGVYISSSVRNWEGGTAYSMESVLSIGTCLISILSFWDGIKHPLPVTGDHLGHIYSSFARCLWIVSSTQCGALEPSLPSQRVSLVFTFFHFLSRSSSIPPQPEEKKGPPFGLLPLGDLVRQLRIPLTPQSCFRKLGVG